MALKVLVLRSKLDKKNAELDKKRSDMTELETREAELEKAISELTPDSTDEERDAVSDKVDELEAEKQSLQEQVDELEAEIADIEQQIKEEEEKAEPGNDPEPTRGKRGKEGNNNMTMRKFFGMNIAERDAFFGKEPVKDFLARVRGLASEKRAVKGAELLIPTEVLTIIRENIADYSKLAKHINLKPVAGKARQNVQGVDPEAVWTEACAALNELDITFTTVEVDAYKVGGFIAICNSTLEDADDVNLATEIINTLSRAIALAIDKAVIFGTGIKMPLGIVTRLMQQKEPDSYPATFRAWEDLHEKNVKKIDAGKAGIELFKAIILASSAAKGKYSRGNKFWAMNDTTYTTLLAEALSINATGAIVSGQTGTMPVIGGAIETFDFIPDNVIVGGYGDLYLMAERAGADLKASEHARFIEDQTVFRGKARYDGLPVIAEGFVVIGINGTTVSANGVTFADDVANNADLEQLTVGTETLSPEFDKDKTEYEITAAGESGKIVAVPESDDAKVTATYDGKKALIGGEITFTEGTKNLIITVKAGNATKKYTVKITKAS